MLQQVADGAGEISSVPEVVSFSGAVGGFVRDARFDFLQQQAVSCPCLPGAADSDGPWDPPAARSRAWQVVAQNCTQAEELIPRLLAVWGDLTAAFGWDRQDRALHAM